MFIPYWVAHKTHRACLLTHTHTHVHTHIHMVHLDHGNALVGRAILPLEGDDDGLLISSKVGVLELYTVGGRCSSVWLLLLLSL